MSDNTNNKQPTFECLKVGHIAGFWCTRYFHRYNSNNYVGKSQKRFFFQVNIYVVIETKNENILIIQCYIYDGLKAELTFPCVQWCSSRSFLPVVFVCI